MTDRITLRLPDFTQEHLSEVYPGSQPGTINPDKLRDALENYALLAHQVVTGDLTPEAAGIKMQGYFDVLARASKVEQVYLPFESKNEDEKER